MKQGQFVVGKIGGIQKRFMSPDINSILPRDKIAELTDYTEIGEYPRFFKQEKVLSKTIVTEAENSDGRRGGVINHTVMYKWDQSFTRDSATYIFDVDTFISEILAGKRRFKMPPTPKLPEADSGLIEQPPPIEWEVQP